MNSQKIIPYSLILIPFVVVSFLTAFIPEFFIKNASLTFMLELIISYNIVIFMRKNFGSKLEFLIQLFIIPLVILEFVISPYFNLIILLALAAIILSTAVTRDMERKQLVMYGVYYFLEQLVISYSFFMFFVSTMGK